MATAVQNASNDKAANAARQSVYTRLMNPVAPGEVPKGKFRDPAAKRK